MDILTSQIHSDFNKARLHASLSRFFGILLGRPVKLLSFDEIKKKLHVGPSVHRGTKSVKLEQIVGSLNRYHEFDRAFRPYRSISPTRWKDVNRAFYEGVNLPAIILYKVGGAYFVVDGHHRVSVARKQKQIYIDAEIREFRTNCSVVSKSNNKDLDLICPT